MNTQKVVNYWLKSAREDFKTAESLLKTKRYAHCLFFAHLFLEKTLKALVVKKTDQHASPTHNLTKLATDAGLKLSSKKEKELKEITTFNIEARYNSYKLAFYKKATKEFSHEWFRKIKKMHQWLKKML